MNKSQLIDTLAVRFEGNRKAAAHAGLESVLDTITREVAKGEKVAITGFGSFEKRVRNARTVRNPQTGQTMKSKKKAVPKFTPGADLKNVISGAKKLPKLTVAAAAPAAKKATAPAQEGGRGGQVDGEEGDGEEGHGEEDRGEEVDARRRPRRRSRRAAKKSTRREVDGREEDRGEEVDGGEEEHGEEVDGGEEEHRQEVDGGEEVGREEVDAAKKSTAKRSAPRRRPRSRRPRSRRRKRRPRSPDSSSRVRVGRR